MVSKRRYKIDIVIFVIVAIGGGLAAQNAVTLGDAWHARTYSPSAEVRQLADDAGMSEAGRKLFYRFSPQIVDGNALEGFCGSKKYGCIEGRYIYILRGATNAEYNRSIVTAAHEMLHVAYERLSTSDKDTLGSLLQTQIKNPITTQGLQIQIAEYAGTADYLNEAHSYLGSEYSDLDGELERHYQDYFSNRTAVTTAYSRSPEAH